MKKRNRNRDVMNHRLNWLMEWLKMRDYTIREERMDFLCIIYNCAKVYLVDEAAQKKTMEVNSLLSLPFSEEKLQQHIFDSIDKRKRLIKYTNLKIKELLRITDEEYALLDPDRRERERTERAERKKAKAQQAEEILDLYELGVPLDEIAQRTAVSVKTVRRRIKAFQQQEQAAESVTGTDFTILRSTEGESVVTNFDNRMKAQELFVSYNRKGGLSMFGDEQLHALGLLMTTDVNFLVLGHAGCGKTTLIKQYMDSLTTEERKKVLIVAPTWKAASNLGGITVHSAFALNGSIQNDTPVTYIPKALKDMDTLIIDEISMLRVDVFTRIVRIIKHTERITHKQIRIIAIGDFGQLAPVCVPTVKEQLDKNYAGFYCFNSPLWDSLHFEKIVLYEAHRQADEDFADHLTMLKYGYSSITSWFNLKCSKGFSKSAITICTTNEAVRDYTKRYIQEHPSCGFETFEAEYDGFLTEELPADKTLTLGFCKVLFLWNGVHYKRGDFGTIVKMGSKGISVKMDTTGEEILVGKKTWTLANGTQYTQYPLCLACAITVNKAQGCTFAEVNIDRGSGFWMPGHLYVALSRCTTLSGIHLVRPLKEKDVHVDVSALEIMEDDGLFNIRF